MILVDTSVWIDFLHGREKVRPLVQLLEEQKIISHPWVFGEFMLGQFEPKRREILANIGLLPQMQVHPIGDLATFLEREKLQGQGLSLIDLQLLYASIIEDSQLWTHDKALAKASRRFGVCYTA